MQQTLYAHISEVLDDPIVTWKKCAHCSLEFAISQKDMEFYKKVSPTFDGKIYLVPPPTLCPDCRQRRRLAFHNERKLYKRKCDATGKDIISAYKPGTPYTIYYQDYYWSDAWDPMSYGKSFDFSRSFFEQFQIFSDRIPKQGLVMQDCENSEYLNFVYKVKNCYLIFAASLNEDCYYGNRVIECKNCVDSLLIKNSRECYECTNISDCYGCLYSENITDCRECVYLFDSIGCADCFMCTNLRNKRFYIKNQEYSREEYYKKIDEFKKKPIGEKRKEFNIFLMNEPHRASNFLNVEKSFGENLQNTKHAKVVFDGDNLENIAYSYFVDDVKDCMDVNYGQGNTRLQYESLGTGMNATSILFSINIWPDVDHLIYCDTCRGCSHCFGCIGLRHKSYCILNKQYAKEEYEILVPKIIEKMREDSEWGEFFPASLSPFGYNETVANEYYPISSPQPSPKGEGASEHATFRKVWFPLPLSEGEGAGGGGGAWFNWSDYESPFPKVEKIIKASLLPEDITQIPDDILNWAIECEVTGKPFRIIRQELEFYRKHSLPIPRRHPDQRHLDRMRQRNPRKLFERNCDCCKKQMITTYAPERPETVYCEVCYEREVIS